ncbi:hypothetical protein [Woodsholea maritima]|uniref:hypothetical protein n=1 Tax=Woodsholea maritima TaxID=240237 RepID=UPI00037A6E65|nr:hypothetical protein [Woodsholea maritima]
MMKRLGLIGLGLVVAGCASDDVMEPELIPTSFIESGASTSAPVRRSTSSRSSIVGGYELIGENFTADITYEDEGDKLAVYYEHRVPGARPLLGDLEMHRPWISEGKRTFDGESYSGLDLKVEMEAGPCRTGGQTFSHFANVQAGRLRYQACAKETGPSESWSEEIFTYLPAIEACQRAAAVRSIAYLRGAGERQVTHVRRDGADVVVRFAYPDAGRMDCVVQDGVRDSQEPFIEWTVVLDGEPALDGEGTPVFVLGEMPQNGTACYQWERVRDETGALIGALGHDACGSGTQEIALGGSR